MFARLARQQQWLVESTAVCRISEAGFGSGRQSESHRDSQLLKISSIHKSNSNFSK